MRKIVVSENITLDGYVGGPNGENDRVKHDTEMFDLVKNLPAKQILHFKSAGTNFIPPDLLQAAMYTEKSL